MTLMTTMCEYCVHFSSEKAFPSCQAYPDGIPRAIFFDGVDQQEALSG